jgi:hypothetical protein
MEIRRGLSGARAAIAAAMLLIGGCHHGVGNERDGGLSDGDVLGKDAVALPSSDAGGDLVALSADGQAAPDSAGLGAEAGAAEAGADGSDLADGGAEPGCGCPPGDYWIEVKDDLGVPSSLNVKFKLAYRVNVRPSACIPNVPWAYYVESLGQFGVYACDSADQTRSCVDLDPGAPGGGSLLLSDGQRVTLVHQGLVTDFTPGSPFRKGMVVTGTYTATGYFPAGGMVPVHGSFRVCATAIQPLL